MRKDFGVKPWFYPLPVLIIGTYDENGNPDAMNAAWGGLYDENLVELCLSASHKTTKNIKLNKEFTVSFGTADTVAACDYVGLVSGNSESEKVKKSGLVPEKSARINAPLFKNLPLTLECKLVGITENGNIIGEVINISADESILTNGVIDVKKLRPIAYEPVANGYCVLGEKVADAFSIGKTLK